MIRTSRSPCSTAAFFNHFDLAAAADFPAPEDKDEVPVWTDVVLKLTKAPYITVASNPRAHPRRRQRARSRARPPLRQPGEGDLRATGGRQRAATGGGTERLPRAIGRDRSLEVILTRADYDADTAERWGWVTCAVPDAELDSFVDTIVARLASFDRTSLAAFMRIVGPALMRTSTNRSQCPLAAMAPAIAATRLSGCVSAIASMILST
jgi:hypothetical protein